MDSLRFNNSLEKFTKLRKVPYMWLQFYYNKLEPAKGRNAKGRLWNWDLQTWSCHDFRDMLFCWHWWCVAMSIQSILIQEAHLTLASRDIIEASLPRQNWLNHGPRELDLQPHPCWNHADIITWLKVPTFSSRDCFSGVARSHLRTIEFALPTLSHHMNINYQVWSRSPSWMSKTLLPSEKLQGFRVYLPGSGAKDRLLFG